MSIYYGNPNGTYQALEAMARQTQVRSGREMSAWRARVFEVSGSTARSWKKAIVFLASAALIALLFVVTSV